MSEPVIKATGARWCSVCRHASHGNPYGAPWMHCSFDDVDTVELYTRDDLVRVAVRCNQLWDESTAFEEDEIAEANRVVDRLTKGET